MDGWMDVAELTWLSGLSVPALRPLANGGVSARSPPEDKAEQRGGVSVMESPLDLFKRADKLPLRAPLSPQSARALQTASRRLIQIL